LDKQSKHEEWLWTFTLMLLMYCRCTYVYRFYVDHTIESRIYEFLQHKSLSGGSSASASTQQPQTEAEQLTVADLSHLLKDTNASSAKNHSRCIEV
jgi:hypothetical protein